MEIKLFEIASNIATPISLASIVIITLYFIYQIVLNLKIFSKLKEKNTFSIINSIINKFFYLSLITMILGIISYVYNQANPLTKSNISLTGNVLCSDGYPVEGAIVFVEGVDRKKKTDTTGWFTIVVDTKEFYVVRSIHKNVVNDITVSKKDIDKPIRLVLKCEKDIITHIDKKNMVYIKGNSFKIGRTGIHNDETPEHEVFLDSYWIDEDEITVEEYIQYCKENSIDFPPDPNFPTMPNYYTNIKWRKHPVVNITWEEANEYCKSVGKKLPTEAQWEVSARYLLNSYESLHPFINENGLPKGNFPDKSLRKFFPNYVTLNYDTKDNFPFTSPVKSFKANSNGIYDLDGNVSEYCFDTYSKNYYEISNKINPINWVGNSKYCVIRGPSWAQWYDVVTKRNRKYKKRSSKSIGFRCAIY